MKRRRINRPVRYGGVVCFVAVALATVANDARSVELEGEVSTQGTDTVVLARFSTRYDEAESRRARAFNLQIAAESINGRVVAGRSTVSFNDAVGERSAAFGYAKDRVLRDRRLAEGTGGGTCQVASTLHAAWLLAGLDVVARSPHSRPSTYIRMGLDATVASGSLSKAPNSGSSDEKALERDREPRAIDLRLRNSQKTPVVIRARASHGDLEVWIERAGTGKPKVSITSEIVERIPFERRVQRNARAPLTSVTVREFGIPGYRIKRTREIRYPDGSVKRDVRVDVYPPTPLILEVGSTLEEARLLDADSPLLSTETEESPTPEALPVIVDGGASRPRRIQLRPTISVTLDNDAP